MKVLGSLSVEQKKSGGQSVKLNRIVVPAHLKVVPLTDGESADQAEAPPANSEAPPANSEAPPANSEAPPAASKATPAADPRFENKPEVEATNPAFRRMIIAASVLAAVIAVLLYTNARNPGTAPEPFATVAPTNPEVIEAALEATLSAPPAAMVPELEQETPPTAQATIVSVLPQPRPVVEAQIESATAVEPDVTPPPLLAEPPLMAKPPSAEAPPATEIAKAPPTEEPAVQVDLIQLVTTGTLEALRNGDASEAETVIHRFVQSQQGRNRPNAEIARMLQRAHDAGTLPVPPQYLRDGQIDITAILLAMQNAR